MLFVTALIAWSVASIAFATPVKVIRSGHKSTTRDVASIPISSSSVSSYRTYNPEERVEVPEGIISILTNARIHPISEEDLLRNADNAIKKICSQTADGTLDEVKYAIYWIHFMAKSSKQPTIAKSKISDILKKISKPEDFPRVLAGAAETNSIAYELLSVRVDNMSKAKKDPKEVLKFLQLDTTETNPIKRKLFAMWVTVVESTYPDDAYEHMFTILTELYEKNDLKLVNALADVTTYPNSKQIAKKTARVTSHKVDE